MARKVVIPVRLKYFRNEGLSVIAAHSHELGLTGFGSSEDEAREAFKKVFSLFVHVSRTEGFLEDILNRLGVDWKWADESPEDYEDVSKLRPDFSETSVSECTEFTPVPEGDKKAITMAA